MRRLSPFAALLAFFLAAPVVAQVPAVPDVRPPALLPLDESFEPQVTIRKQEGNTIEEHRVNGKLYKITVTPENGTPYTLVDPRGDGAFVPQDAPGTPQIAVPTWVIGTF